MVGTFTSVLFGTVNRSNAAAFTYGGGVLPWNPSTNYQAQCITQASSTTLYLGGGFTTVSGASRNYAAEVDMNSGLPTGWNPSGVNNIINAIAVSANYVYLGGQFTSPQGYLAAFDRGFGNQVTYAPGVNNIVTSFALTNGVLFAGGSFTSPRNYLIGLVPLQ